MKRAGRLISKIVHFDNLYEAYVKARRGKRQNKGVVRFGKNIDEEILKIAEELKNGTYELGNYFYFTVFDPKKRTICAAPFRDRVAMHAMMRICHPIFDDYQISGSYASRIGKGTYKAITDLKDKKKNGDMWFLKMDVVHYFDSVNHDILLYQLKSLFKDPVLLAIFERLIRGYEKTPNCGLPIGNLTSQYFANHYLSPADHYLKEKLRVKYLFRYMDDIIVLDFDKKRICEIAKVYSDFLRNNLKLQLHEPIINRCRYGVPFLGYIVYPYSVRLNHRSRRRFKSELSKLMVLYRMNTISERKYRERMTALYAFVNHADANMFKKKILDILGILP